MDPTNLAGVIGSITSAFATIVLAVLTGRYVHLTNALVEEAKASKHPNVFVDIEFDSYEVRFIVGNSGSTPCEECAVQGYRQRSMAKAE